MKSQELTMFNRNIIVPLMLGSLLFTAVNSAFASPEAEMRALEQKSTRIEGAGFIGGALVGGLIAGPPGAVIAATMGLLGASTHNGEQKKDLLASQLQDTRSELYALQEQQHELQLQYQLALQELEERDLRTASLNGMERDTVVICCANTELVLHFRTGSATLENHYHADLQRLAASVRDIPDAYVEITGYADRRGNTSDNLQLSQQRIDAVRRALAINGVSQHLMLGNAFGDSRPLHQDESLEGNFFDRRVSIRVRSRSNEFIGLAE